MASGRRDGVTGTIVCDPRTPNHHRAAARVKTLQGQTSAHRYEDLVYHSHRRAHTYVTLNWQLRLRCRFLALGYVRDIFFFFSQYVPARINCSRNTERVQNHLADPLVLLWTLSTIKFVDFVPCSFVSSRLTFQSRSEIPGQISKIIIQMQIVLDNPCCGETNSNERNLP